MLLAQAPPAQQTIMSVRDKSLTTITLSELRVQYSEYNAKLTLMNKMCVSDDVDVQAIMTMTSQEVQQAMLGYDLLAEVLEYSTANNLSLDLIVIYLVNHVDDLVTSPMETSKKQILLRVLGRDNRLSGFNLYKVAAAAFGSNAPIWFCRMYMVCIIIYVIVIYIIIIIIIFSLAMLMDI